MTKTYSYSDIEQMVEIERMYLLETNEKTWQFIAKSAFSSEEEQKQFESFMNEKLADAKENPEEYPSVTKNPENAENAEKAESGALHQNAALEDDVVEADEPEITRVDTSHMCGSLRAHGEDLNRIGEGVNKAVEERLKSERLRTELITNVSHDIKTPLTSIINLSLIHI